MFILIYLLVFYILLCYTLSLLFPKARVEASKAWIPGVNFAEWCKIIGQKPTHALWLLFPIVNIFTFAGMAVDIVRSFGKYEFKHSAAAVLFAPGIFYKIAKDPKDQYVGKTVLLEKAYAEEMEEARTAKDSYKLAQLESKNPYKKTTAREWTESIVFAVFAASFIRMFLIEAYVIPTPSMEGSLNVGDFLFVSKAHYGIRTPMTVAMFPLLHNQIPFLGTESYLSKPSLDYYRLPAIEKVQVGKPFVFNWPVGDSVYITSSRPYAVSQVAREQGSIGDRELIVKVKNKDFVVRPTDKKDHYIKRCVAGPGDSLLIIDRQLYLNGKAVQNPLRLQFLYEITLPQGVTVSTKKLDEWGIDFGDNAYGTNELFRADGFGVLFLDQGQVDKLKALDPNVVIKVADQPTQPETLFPFDTTITARWSLDNFGPVWIPAAGATIDLTLASLPYYRRAIQVYENNKLEVKGSDIYINGVAAKSYTFKQDYYWAMGDNRHNSEDSRAWGFVPMDHIVGKPLFIWFSTKEGNIRNGINWDRIFKSANKDF